MEPTTAADGTTTFWIDEVQPPEDGAGEFAKMPALFQNNWRELAFKWALREAALNGYDRVAWTSGEMQVTRYSLRKVADRIECLPAVQAARRLQSAATVARHRRTRVRGSVP